MQLTNGIIIGSIYSLIGLGFSLLFSVMGILNLAYGEFYMLASYLAFFIFLKFNLNIGVMILIIISIMFFLGCTVEIALIKPIKRKTESWIIPTLIGTLGLQTVFQESARLTWGASYRNIPGYFLDVIRIGSFSISHERIIIFCVSVFLLTSTWFFLNKTKFGSAILAVAQDKESAELVGINTNNVYTITFGISCALVAVAGILLMPLYCVYPTVGQEPLLRSFAVAFLGGMGNIGGAILSGFILGVAEALAVGYISASIKDLISFIVIIVIITLYPSGIGGILKKSKGRPL